MERLVRLLVLAFTGAVALVPAAPSAAASVQGCAGVVPDFCMTYGVNVVAPGTSTDERRAAAPFDLSLSLSNSSPTHDSDSGRWLQTISLALLSAPGRSPQVTPSKKLPDGLLIAGTSADCSSDNGFAGCTAGHGSALINISGTGVFDGPHSTTFGIDRITNLNPPSTPGAVADYDVHLTLCVPTPIGPCMFAQPEDVDLAVVPGGGSGDETATFAVSGDDTVDGFNVSYSLDTASLNLQGQSDQLNSGPAGKTYTILRLPATCGPVHADATATDRNADSATSAQPFTIIGCPTTSAASATGAGPDKARFKVRAAAGVRALDHYVWDFGDGKHVKTTSPKTTHTYANGKPRRVTVSAVDTVGAQSSPRTIALAGSKLTALGAAKAPQGSRVTVHGVLSSGKSLLAHRRLTVAACNAKGHHCHTIAFPTTGRRGTYAVTTKLTRATRFRIDFRGGKNLLGTRTTRAVRLKR